MPRTPPFLLGPRHLHPRVSTEAQYREAQGAAIARGMAEYPNLVWTMPWQYLGPRQPVAFVSGGAWQVRCLTEGCANCPSLDIEWRLALCWDCGAIYEQVEVPGDADAIARVLVQRPHLSQRNWLPHETLADLERENTAHGVGA